MQAITQQIEQQLAQARIVLYMKGSAQFPQCGFSAKVADILDSYDIPYTSINVLEDEAIRQGIKDYANWPTIPQLYIDGQFMGGCDVVSQLHESGELKQILSGDDA